MNRMQNIFFQSERRNSAIDLIRGLSIIAVILLHIYIRIPFDNNSIGKLLPNQAITILFHSVYYDVIIFFVFSIQNFQENHQPCLSTCIKISSDFDRTKRTKNNKHTNAHLLVVEYDYYFFPSCIH